jgi:hypothetical protein
MLFTFNKFWKTLLFLGGSWLSLSLIGFEFTAVTILSLIYCSNFSNSETLI